MICKYIDFNSILWFDDILDHMVCCFSLTIILWYSKLYGILIFFHDYFMIFQIISCWFSFMIWWYFGSNNMWVFFHDLMIFEIISYIYFLSWISVVDMFILPSWRSWGWKRRRRWKKARGKIKTDKSNRWIVTNKSKQINCNKRGDKWKQINWN